VEIRLFSEVIRDARAGDPDAIEAILARYMPLIDRRCMNGCSIDEDMRQYIILRIIANIHNFDPDKYK